MALKKRGRYWYGDSRADIRPELARYSKTSDLAEHFADAFCACGSGTFRLTVDEDAGAAIRICAKCGAEHSIGDSADYLDEAMLEECECPCGNGEFEITTGVSLYDDRIFFERPHAPPSAIRQQRQTTVARERQLVQTPGS